MADISSLNAQEVQSRVQVDVLKKSMDMAKENSQKIINSGQEQTENIMKGQKPGAGASIDTLA
jgi:hypothetical protein